MTIGPPSMPTPCEDPCNPMCYNYDPCDPSCDYSPDCPNIAPVIAGRNVLNAASYARGSVSPGQIVSIFGTTWGRLQWPRFSRIRLGM